MNTDLNFPPLAEKDREVDDVLAELTQIQKQSEATRSRAVALAGQIRDQADALRSEAMAKADGLDACAARLERAVGSCAVRTH